MAVVFSEIDKINFTIMHSFQLNMLCFLSIWLCFRWWVNKTASLFCMWYALSSGYCPFSLCYIKKITAIVRISCVCLICTILMCAVMECPIQIFTGAGVFFTNSIYWNGTWKLTPFCSTMRWPRRCEAPTTVTGSPLSSCSVGGFRAESSGKFIFMMRVCGYPSLELPVTVYGRERGTGGGRS